MPSHLLAALALFAAQDPLAAGRYDGPVIDSHAHVRLADNDGLDDDQPIGTAALRALDAAAGVQRSALIVMAGAGDPAAVRAQNDAVIAAAATAPGRFYPVASVHPMDDDAAIAELERLAALGVKQIKLHPNAQSFDVADPAVARITARCGELGVAVLLDSYNPLDPVQTSKLVALTTSQPKTRFVLAHMTFSQFRETLVFAMLRRLERSDNVWFDLSFTASVFADSPVEAEFVWTMRQIGMDRILFGSDWPMEDPAVAISAIRRLDLTPAEERQVFHDNVVALLDLD